MNKPDPRHKHNTKLKMGLGRKFIIFPNRMCRGPWDRKQNTIFVSHLAIPLAKELQKHIE